MRVRTTSRRCGTATLALGAALAALLAGAAPVSATALLTPHVPAAVARHIAQRVGAPDPATSLTLAIALPMHDQAGLTALLHDIYNPASPNYRHYLSVAEFTARFGPAAPDYAAAVQFFQAQGLRIIATSANRYIIDAAGSVADIERIFHTALGLYRHPTENRNFIAPDREPSLDLAVPVLQVVGLDNFALPKPRRVHANMRTQESRVGSGPGGDYIGSDIRTAYYGGTELSGKGQKLGLMELVGWNPNDITLYFQSVHQKNTVPIVGISTDGTHIHCKYCDDGEQALDIEYAASIAPGLDEMQIYVATSPESVLNRMASDNTSKQLSTSWGWNNDFAVDDPLFQEMAAQGQTFLTASGDYSSLQDSGPWPEEDANLTAVGGTDLATDGPGGPWKSESGWSGSAGGPSLDGHIKIEPYQLPYITVPTDGSRKRRNVPDIAGQANTNNLECFNGACQGGWGGTSFASPIWAGMIALVNEKAAVAGKPPVGFLNPTLYAQGHTHDYKETFHDVAKGKSGIYNAVKNYDLVTGFGSPLGKGLVQILSGAHE
jgi:subtilase family serine protease